MAKEETSAEDRIAYLEMQLAEVLGKTPGKPKVKARPDFDYKKEHGVDLMDEVPLPASLVNPKNPDAKMLIPAKVILMPTKENPFHTQGEEFECDAALAETHIRRGFATHVRTMDEHAKKLKNDAAKEAAKEAKK